MADSEQKPWEQNYSNGSEAQSPDGAKPWEQAYDKQDTTPARGFSGWARDIAATAVKGAIAVPEAVVGLADIPTGGRVGKFLENDGGAVGFRPKQAKEIVNEWHSDATKEAQRKFQEAEGIGGKFKAAIENPSIIGTAVGESIPPMLAGGVAARGFMAARGALAARGAAQAGLGEAAAVKAAEQAATKFAPYAGAAGEGLTMAGSAAEQIRQETPDGLLTPTQAGAAVATGAAGAAFGYGGGRLAQRLGIGDVDTMIAQGSRGMADEAGSAAARAAANPLVQQQAMKGIPRRVIEGAISEGFLEELPQSVAEQVFQNVALGKNWLQDVDSAAVMGVLSGNVMGGAASGYHGMRQPAPRADGLQPPAQPGQPAPNDPATDAAPQPSPALQRIQQAYAEQLAALQAQEQGEVLGPQSTPPDGAAVLAQQQAQEAARRQAAQEASRAVASPDDEIFQSTGTAVDHVREQVATAAAQGGALSPAALTAIDSGAADQMQQAAALTQAAELAKKTGAAPQEQKQPAAKQALSPEEEAGLASTLAGSDLVKGSIESSAASELQAKLDEVHRRAAENGSWNVPLMVQRKRIEDAMARLTATYSTPTNEQQALQAELDAEQQGNVPRADRADRAFQAVTEAATAVSAARPGAVEAAGVSDQLEDALFKERDATISAIENDWMNGNGRRRMTNIEQAIYDAASASTLDADSAAQIIETALENDRPDLAQYAASRAMRAAKSMGTTPGVPQSSPKYGKIKSDLEARKKQALDAASALQEIVNSKQAPQAVAGVGGATPTATPGAQPAAPAVEAAGPAKIPATTGVARVPQASQAQQADGVDQWRKSDETNTADFEEAKAIIQVAMATLKNANARQKESERGSLEWAKSKLEADKAMIEIARANILAYPFTAGPEYQKRVDNYEASVKAANELESKIQAATKAPQLTQPITGEGAGVANRAKLQAKQVSPQPKESSEPKANQAQQGSTQSTQAGGQAIAGPAAAPTAGPSAAPGGSGVQAAGLNNGATTQNLGAQAAPASSPQGAAQGNASWAALTPEQRRRARLEHEIATGMTNNGGVMAKLRPSAIEKRKQELAAMGDAGKLADAMAPAPAETGQVFPTRAAAMQEGERIGGGYTVEPINGAGRLGQHRLVIQRNLADAMGGRAGTGKNQGEAPANQTPAATTTATVAQQRAAVSEPLPPTDIRMGDKVMVDGEMYTVTGPLKEGRKSVGVVADRDADTDPLMGVRQVFLRGDDAIRAKIAANSQSNEQAAAAQQAQAATESVAQSDSEEDDRLPVGWKKSGAFYEFRNAAGSKFTPSQVAAVIGRKAVRNGMHWVTDVPYHQWEQAKAKLQAAGMWGDSQQPYAAPASLQDGIAQAQAALATHADPGQAPEAATSAVVTDSLKTAARNEDTKPSEMRKWLVAEIDRAMLDAPEKDATEFVSFDVPGDGVFKVQKSRERLLEFRKEVMASPGFKDGGQKQAKPQQNDSILNGGGTTETIRAFLADGDVQGAVEFAKLKGVEFTPVPPQMKMSADGKGKVKHIPASVKSSVPSVAEGLTQVEAEQINQYLTAEQARAEPADAQDAAAQQSPAATKTVAQPITRADVAAAQQQAATLIAERIDAMTAGEVNSIAKKFLPTMGMKPTMSKANNKAAMTDAAKVNLMAAAAEVGVKLPADVRRALDAEMQGKVADAGQDDGLAARADGDDDYLRTLFGGSDTAEQDAVSPAQTQKIDAKAAVPMLRALAQEKRAEAEDWSGRKYKGNKSQVNLRGDGPSNQETMSVSAVNESRRRKAVESLVAQANAADKLADRIESGSINIQSALDNISSAVDSDMKRDGGKPSIGKSRQDMFEGYISSQLLADPYAGYGEGTVSSALRAMYEERVADVQPAVTYINGDRAEYTGNTETIGGGLFYEVRFTEGAKNGKTAVTQRAPDGANPAQSGPTAPTGIVTPQLSSNPEQFIKIAADSIKSLRKVDVDRVLNETPAPYRQEVASYIRDKRKDLADEVDDVMADIQPKAAEKRFNVPTPPTWNYRLKQRGGSTYLIPPVGQAFAPETRRALRDWARDAGYSASIITDNEISVAAVTDGPPLDYIVDGVKEQAYGRQADKERAAAPAPEAPSGTRRDPAKVSMFNPYNDGDIVTIGGQDWTVKQDTPGWYLTNTGNWRGTHPTIRNVKAMADLIRAVEQAAVAQPAATQPEAPKLTQAEAKSLMAWQDLGQKDGVKTHILTFYESQADKDAKRGRMIVAKVSKGDRSANNWMVEGDDKPLAVLGMAKKRAEEIGMAKAVADGFVAEDNPFAEYNALAQQYGYEVRPDGAIGSDGKFPGPTMKVKGGRLRIESGSGDLLASYAGTSPDSLGKFLESFWYAEKKADGFVEQAAAESDYASTAEQVEAAQELLLPIRQGEMITDDVRQTLESLLKISSLKGFDQPTARRLLMIAGATKAAIEKVMRTNPVSIDDLATELGKATGEAEKKKAFDRAFNAASQIAQTDPKVKELLDIYNVEKSILDGIASERGLYGMKWAERNVSSRWTGQSQKVRSVKQRLVDAVNKAAPSGVRQSDASAAPAPKKKPSADQTRADVTAAQQQAAQPQGTAEQAIRDAFQALPSVSLGEFYPITVQHNGREQQFLASQRAIKRGYQPHAALTLLQIRRGRMIAGDDLQDIAYTYKLNGKNELTEESVRPASDELIKRWSEAFAPTAESQPVTPLLTAQTPEENAARFEIGKSLTKEQRKQVLDSLVDVYKSKGAEREFKGQDGNGNDRYGYTHSPDLFEKSDITGAMVRYYVTLPDGRIAHPTELFPNVSASDIERMVLEQDAKRRRIEAFDNAIKPFYSDFDSANLMAVTGQVVISKGDRFAVIPDRIGSVNRARQQGWEPAKAAAPAATIEDAGETKQTDKGVVMFSRTGAQSANANESTSRAWYDRFVSLLPESYRNDPHRREPLPAEDWNVQRAAEVRSKVESLNKQLRGENDRKGYGPISIDGLGNLQVSALQVSRDDLNGPIKALAKELGAGIAITNVRTGDIQALQDSGFVPETSLAPVADRIMGRPFDDPANRYAADARAYGTIMTYQPRGFPAAMFSFAGARAATADTHALVTAQDRLDAGEDPETVRQETGWFKGNDGKWRYEISDNEAKVDMALLANLHRGGFAERAIEHVSYRQEPDGTYSLTLAPKNPQKTSDFVRMRSIPANLLPSLLPQSALDAIEQNHGEEDMIGPNLDDARRVRAPFQFRGFNALPLDLVMDHPKLFAAYPALREIMVRVDPKLGNGATFAVTDYADGTVRNVITIGNPLAKDVDSALLHEIQHGIQTVEGFATGGNSELFASGPMFDQRARNLAADLGENLTGSVNAGPAEISIAAKYGDQNEMGEIARKHGFATVDEALSFLKSQDEKRTPFGQYRRLAGEVEARNTQARQKLTADQRRATSPGSTADVADADVIVVFNGNEMANAPMPTNAVPDAAATAQPLRTPAATIRAAITKAYGKLLGQLESKGLVTLTQTQEQAIEAAARARADKTGQPLAEVRASLMGSVSNSVATDTPAFKRWFGDSKVVDADGKPLVVMHASTYGDISEFKKEAQRFGKAGFGFYFSDASGSNLFAEYGDRFQMERSASGEQKAVKTYPVYLSLQNPLVVDHVDDLARHLDRGQKFGVARGLFGNLPADAMLWLQRQGYDGIITRETTAPRVHKTRGLKILDRNDPKAVSFPVYVAFEPAQIKSATGNNGNFDPNDLDIRRSANGAIQGFFDPQTGQSFLIADNLTAEAAPGVLMHEVGIHMAADGSMKALFNRAALMLKLQKGNPFIKAVQARMDAAGETSGEEAAAYIAEAYENDRANAPASVQRWLADLLAAVKAWMFKKGIMGADRLTVADIAAVARANAKTLARGYVTRSKETGAQSLERAMLAFARAYHGTPHRGIEKFSTDKIGTGEGAQAYGWGLYFASKREVAEHYRETLSARDAKGYVDAHLNARRLVERFNGDPEWAAEVVKEQRDALAPSEENYTRLDQTLKFIESGDYAKPLPERGQLYEVEVPEDNELLLWDKPLSEQPKNVKQRLKSALSNLQPYILANKARDVVDLNQSLADMDGLSGEIVYRRMSSLVGSDMIASRILNKSGIKGIKYLDGDSRNAGEGSYNYVIFTGDDVQIERVHFSRTSGDQTQTEAFKRWFAGSKVVDADGKPLVVYRGRQRDYSVMQRNVENSNFSYGEQPDSGGLFFHPDLSEVDYYMQATHGYSRGANIMPVYLSLQNPAYLKSPFSIEEQARSLREAEARGHDGAFLSNGDIVVFRPEQIKSAIGNNGNFDPNDPDIRFSRAQLNDLKASALDQLHQTLSHPGKVSLWDKTVGTMRHLAERNPAFKPVYEAAQRFIDDVSMLANDAAEFAPRLLPRVETWRDLRKSPISAQDNKAVARPLFDGTLLWGRDVDGKPALVRDLESKYANLSADDKAQMMLKAGRIDPGVLKMWLGLPLDQYETAVNTRFTNTLLKAGVVWTDQELKDLFQATPEQASLYREARKAIDRSIDMTSRADMLRLLGEPYAPMRDAVLEAPTLTDAMMLLVESLEQDAKENPDDRDRLAGLMHGLRQRQEKAAELMAQGYAPLSRFGRYTVDVVDAAGERKYFGMFETAREANQMALRMRSTFQGAAVTQGTMSQEAYKLFAGITPESLEMFGNMLGLDSEGSDAQDKAFQEYLRLTKNNHSALKRLIHRQGIAGFSEDVGRVLASFVYSNARQAAGALNAGTVERAIGSIPKEQGELKDVAMGLQSYIRDPQEEGQAIRGMLFAQYLGGSVASAFVNMTQPFQITMPWLSQYGGMGKAAKQMARALKDMGTKGIKYEPDLERALHDAVADGTVAPQEIHQIMAQARGTGSLRVGDGTRMGDARAAAANNWERVKVAWGQPFALAEQFNRRSTFIAAYRLAKEQGMAAPAEFARRAVLETQFVYSKANKMRWGRGAIGGALMTFKTYSVSYLELMHRMWNQGEPGSPERAAGRRAVGWAVAMLLLMGGAGGLPFMEDAEDLIDGAGQLMGYNISTKHWRKQLLRDTIGKELGDFVEQGISGLPGAPIDVSGRLGMGNLLPGTGLLLAKQNRERDLLEIAGPAGDLVARGFTGARKALTGDVAGAALEMSPTAVRNAVKGVDMATSGIYKDAKGYKVIDTTMDEAIAKAIGFQPRSVAEVQQSNSFMQRSKSFYIQTSNDIKAQWAQALFNKDDAALERVRERLADWNRDNPDQPIVVKMPDVWKRVREMGKDRTQRITDTAPKALRQQMREMARENG